MLSPANGRTPGGRRRRGGGRKERAMPDTVTIAAAIPRVLAGGLGALAAIVLAAGASAFALVRQPPAGR
jgi:hypothetical protein